MQFKNMSAVSTFSNVDKKPLKLHDNTVIQLRLYYELPTNDFRDFTKSIDAKRGSAKKLYPSKFKLSSRGWEIKVNAPEKYYFKF